MSTREGMDNLWLPFTQMGDPLGRTPHIVRGEGCFLIDDQGRRYLDGIASWWVNLHGHNHPRLIDALKRQAEVLPHCSLGSMTHEPALEVAAGLAEIAPAGLTRVFFSDDGSTAVETALKISLQYFQQNGEQRRTRFAALQRAYHGDTLGAVSVGGIESYHGKFRPLCFEALFAEAPDCARCDEGGDTMRSLPGGPKPDCSLKCLASLERILEQHGSTLCGLIVEPLVQGAVGMRMYRAAAPARMRELCDAHGVHLIADCVAVAFGRTGTMFACEHAGISPDLIAIAKGLTGGYVPLAATLATERIYQGFVGSYESDRKLAHGHSFTGNPLAAACAAENLKLFREERVIASLAPKIAKLRTLWAGLGELSHVAELRQTGLIAALNLFEDAEARTPYPAQAQVARRVALDCIERGLFLRPLGDALYLLPPLAISEDELALAVGMLREAIVSITG